MINLKYFSAKITSFLGGLKAVDYLIIVLVVLFGVVLLKFFNPEEKWIRVEIIDDNVPIFLAYSLKKGDIEKSPSGEMIAEVGDVVIYDTPLTPSSNKDIRVEAKILARVNSRTKEYEYKNKIVKTGAPIELRFGGGMVSGIITSIDSAQYQQKLEPIIVTVRLYEMWPWFADSIKIGDVNVDENGEKIVEVLEKQTTQAEVTVNTDTGSKVLTTNPQKVDLTLKIRLFVQKFGDEYVYKKDRKIILGELLSFNIGQTRVLDANIINIERQY